MRDWRTLTPVYTPVLSAAHLVAEGELFHLGDGQLNPAFPQAPHIHDCYEMGFIRSGHGILVLGEREYAFVPGQVYIINDLQPHMGYALDDPVELFAIHFQPAIIDGSWISKVRSETQIPFLPNFNLAGPLLPLDDPVNAAVRGILEGIRAESGPQLPAWEVVVSGVLVQAAGHLARWMLDQPGAVAGDQRRRAALRRIQPILRMIEDRFNEPLTLDEMARAAHLSRSHCCALFQAAMDTTPISYRNARRLIEGQRLLYSTNLTIKEIAYEVGFSSVQEFDRLFARELGLSPRDFRRRLDAAIQKIGS